MAEASMKCLVCAKTTVALKGGICEPCQERIQREALGEQASVAERAGHELTRQGVPANKQ